MSSLDLTVVLDLPYLAGEINDAHNQATFHGRAMLLEAKRAGDALIEAKKLLPHGAFIPWIEKHCRCSRQNAHRYIQVAERFKCIPRETLQDFAHLSIRDFLGRKERKPAPPPLTHDDAARLLKLNAMHQRGGTANEREVAGSKIEASADQMGMSPEELLKKARRMAPEVDPPRPEDDAFRDNATARMLRQRVSRMSKDELVDEVVRLWMDELRAAGERSRQY